MAKRPCYIVDKLGIIFYTISTYIELGKNVSQ